MLLLLLLSLSARLPRREKKRETLVRGISRGIFENSLTHYIILYACTYDVCIIIFVCARACVCGDATTRYGFEATLFVLLCVSRFIRLDVCVCVSRFIVYIYVYIYC